MSTLSFQTVPIFNKLNFRLINLFSHENFDSGLHNLILLITQKNILKTVTNWLSYQNMSTHFLIGIGKSVPYFLYIFLPDFVQANDMCCNSYIILKIFYWFSTHFSIVQLQYWELGLAMLGISGWGLNSGNWGSNSGKLGLELRHWGSNSGSGARTVCL